MLRVHPRNRIASSLAARFKHCSDVCVAAVGRKRFGATTFIETYDPPTPAGHHPPALDVCSQAIATTRFISRQPRRPFAGG